MSSKEVYDHWHAQRENEVGDRALAQWHATALELCPPLEGKFVLEVGCGRGDFALELAARGARVVAVDFSEAAITTARKRAEGVEANVEFKVADAQNLPFESGSFDLVISCECLEHVPHPQRMLGEVSRVLKPSGCFILTTENYSNGMILLWMKTWLTGKPFNSGGNPQPIEHFFVFWRIVSMIRKASLRPKLMTGTYHVFLTLPRLKPDTFVVERFNSRFFKKLFRPLARHMAFVAEKI